MVEFFEAEKVFPTARTSRSFGREEVRVGAGDLGSPAGFWRLRRPDLGNGGVVDLRFDRRELEWHELSVGEELVGGEHGHQIWVCLRWVCWISF